MPKIILDTFTYDDIVRVIEEDHDFLMHKLRELAQKYRKAVIRQKPIGKKAYGPTIIKSNRGLTYRIVLTYMDSHSYKAHGFYHTIHAYYLKPEGLYLVACQRIADGGDAHELSHHAFYTPHFFDRFRERQNYPAEMSKLDLMNEFLTINHQNIVGQQNNDKYPNGIFVVYDNGVGLGTDLGNGVFEIKTYISFEMLRGEQIDKKNLQLDFLNEYKELVYGTHDN